MPQVLCVHCQHPIEEGAPRRGNMVTCPSCKGQVYVPQVKHVPTFEERQAAERATAASKQQAGPRTYKPSTKRPAAVNSNSLSITFIVLAILVVGGAGFAVGGYFVYKAIKGHMDARAQMATKVYDFEKQDRPLPATPPRPVGGAAGTPSKVVAWDNSTTGNKPTRQDLEKLLKKFQAYMEVGKRCEQDYQNDLTKTGLKRLLVAERIAVDKDFSQARQILKDAREVIVRHREIYEMEDEAFFKELAKLKLEGIPTEVMVGRIRAISEAAQPEVNRARALDATIATHYEQAINHLESTRGTWKLEGESLVFNDVKDADRYKTFFDEVDKCAQMQVDLEQKIGREAVPKWKASIGWID